MGAVLHSDISFFNSLNDFNLKHDAVTIYPSFVFDRMFTTLQYTTLQRILIDLYVAFNIDLLNHAITCTHILSATS